MRSIAVLALLALAGCRGERLVQREPVTLIGLEAQRVRAILAAAEYAPPPAPPFPWEQVLAGALAAACGLAILLRPRGYRYRLSPYAPTADGQDPAEIFRTPYGVERAPGRDRCAYCGLAAGEGAGTCRGCGA